MATWYAIRLRMKTPPEPAVLDQLKARLKKEDYDFPLDCLAYDDWIRYREPFRGGDFIEEVMAEFGIEGSYWISSNDPMELTDANLKDEDIVEFGPGVDPYARARAAKEKNMQEHIQALAEQYIRILVALELDPLPIRFSALSLLGLYVPEARRKEFEEAVKQRKAK